MLRTKLILPSLALALAGGAFAQGDDCSTAAAINTVGTFAFDTSANTTTGFDGGGSCLGGDNITFDTYWQWTAPAAGDYQFDTEGSSFDTQLSLHTGVGCAATCLAHDDDAGTGLLSQIQLSAVNMGDTFLIQLGGFGTGQGLGSLNITSVVIPPSCASLPDDSFEDNDDCSTAAAVMDGTYPGLKVTDIDLDHYSTCVDDGATINIDVLFIDAQADMDLFLWDAADVNCGTGFGTTDLANGFSTTDNETISWTNTTGADLDVIIEVQLFSGDCNTYDLVVAGSGTCDGSTNAGTAFCDPANLNSTGVPAVLSGTFGTGIGSDLHLEMTDGVPGQLAYMLAGNMATAGIPVSNGQFCLVGAPGAAFFRYNVGGTDMNSIGGFDAFGTYINAVGTSTTGFGFDVPSNIPSGVPIPIMAGDTWHFQGWYRDTPAASGSSNFTNGLSVTF